MALPGVGPFTTVNVGEYRRFLPRNHRYRRDLSFGPFELCHATSYRTHERSQLGVVIARDEDSELTYYQGYVHDPLFEGLRYYKPYRQSVVDLSHNLANLFSRFV